MNKPSKSLQSQGLKGVLAIVLASFLWGTTGTAATYSPAVNPLAIGAFAMGIGGLLLLITARKKIKQDLPLMLAQPMVLLFGTVSVAVYPLAFYSSMRFSGVALGTVISIASAPFFAALLERLICKKVMSRQWMFSFTVGAIGIVLLSLGKDPNNTHANGAFLQNMGIVLGLVAGLSYAGYSWAAKRLIENGVHSQSSMAGMFGIAAAVLLPSLWFTGEQLMANVTNASVALYMAIVPMFIGYLCFSYGLKLIDASKATLITLIEPLIATLLAVFIVGEHLNTIAWWGMGLVSLCLLMQSFSFKKPLPVAGGAPY